MFGKKKKDSWFKTGCKLYRRRKLVAPYDTLFYYYTSTVTNVPQHDPCRGHSDFLSLNRMDGRLDAVTKDLLAVLPQGLADNFSAARAKFDALGEDPAYEDVLEAYAEHDAYTDEHGDEMAEILRDYITEMTERHVL